MSEENGQREKGGETRNMDENHNEQVIKGDITLQGMGEGVIS